MRAKNISLADLPGPVLVGVAYYLGAEAAFYIGTLSDKIFAPFWPPNAILLCALALVPFEQWPLYILVALPAHVIAELRVGMGSSQIITAFLTNCLVAVPSALILRYLLGPPPWFNTLHRVTIYLLVAAVGAPGIAAFGGAFVRILGAGEFANYWLYWTQWYVANALGNLTLAPLLLASMIQTDERSEFGAWRRGTEVLLLLVGLGLTSTISFKANALAKPCYFPAILYLPLPFILWATVRFRARGASIAILVVTVATLSSMLRGTNIFDGDDIETNVRALQLFLIAIGGPILLLSASVDELRQAAQTTARLSQYLLGTHDDERRQVARRLLDDICQRLAAATWLPDKSQDPAVECKLKQSIRDLREISYLLHPPLLDEAGLEPALRARLKDYTNRTGIGVTLEASRVGRLPPDVELTVFRVIEEALANVQRHSVSGAARVSVRAHVGDKNVIAEIENAERGKSWMSNVGALIMRLSAGIPPSGMGLAHMRERLRRLGGRLEIISRNRKTLVRAIVPIAAYERSNGSI
jgi:integral membrane sensor domain MASE1